MAVGFPTKVSYANGDVFSASDINDTNGTINLIKPTAKGDLFAGSAANTYTKLAVGTNGQVLTAASGQATGLEWAAPASMTQLATGSVTVGGTAITISSIPSGYRNIYFEWTDLQGSTGQRCQVRFNGDTGANYSSQLLTNASPTAINGTTYIDYATTSTSSSNSFNGVTLYDYASTSHVKLLSLFAAFSTTTGGTMFTTGNWNSTAAITSITFTLSAGTFSGGDYIMYGVK
jgi:hypothetical protein